MPLPLAAALYALEPLAPLALAFVSLVVAGVALVGCYIPAPKVANRFERDDAI